jgi:hypothetical protein
MLNVKRSILESRRHFEDLLNGDEEAAAAHL